MDHSNLENIVITTSTALGLLGGVLLYFWAPVLSPIFFAFGVTSLVYRFLGGISQNSSFSVGALKLGGSAAFLYGCFMVFDSKINQRTEANQGMVILEEPKNWYPVKVDDGLPGRVSLGIPNQDTISYFLDDHDMQTIQEHEYKLVHEGRSYQVVRDMPGPEYVIGTIESEDLGEDLFHRISSLNQLKLFKLFPYPSELRPDYQTLFNHNRSSTKDLSIVDDKIPFIISTNQTNYFIKDREGKLIASDDPQKEKYHLFDIQGDTYFVVVTHANLLDSLNYNWYSEYLVGKISKEK